MKDAAPAIIFLPSAATASIAEPHRHGVAVHLPLRVRAALTIRPAASRSVGSCVRLIRQSL